MMRGVLTALVLAGALLLAQGPPGDGAVVSLSPRWAMNGYGDQKIVTDAEITDDRGGRHLITVDGGRIGGVELHVSDAPTLHQGQRVWIRGSKVQPVVQEAVIFGRWPTSGPIPYYVNANSSRVTADEALQALAQAAAAWPTQSTAAISATYAGPTSGTTTGNNHKSEIFFRNDPSGGYVAQTLVWEENGVFVDADMVLNDAYTMLATSVPYPAQCGGLIWLVDPATHEFGHFFGLQHSTVPDATMYPVMQYCDQSWRTLAQDDIDGIEANYPAQVSAPPPPPQPASGPVLSARAYKVKGVQKVDLAWSGFTTALDVYRDGVRILSGTPNDGAQTDDLGKRGSGTYQYRACASGLSSPCADAVAVF